MSSSTKAWLFLLLVSLLLISFGQWVAGREGVLWAVLISLSINSFVYFYSDQRILEFFKGQLIAGQDPWGLTEMVQRLAKKARLPQPRVIVVADSAPQALSVGRNRKYGTIVLTEGLLKALSKDELEAVVAFEMACIARLDTLGFAVASTFGGAILLLTSVLDAVFRLLLGSRKQGLQAHFFTHLLAPVAGMIVKFSVSRSGFYSTDALAAKWSGNSKALAQALWKLDSFTLTRPIKVPVSLAPIFIVNPLTADSWTRYFLVQPPVERRIRRLVGYYPI